MFQIKVNDAAARAYLQAYPKEASRALETAIDKMAYKIWSAERREVKRIFTKPVPYTINSLKYTKTRRHNMRASVWFKEPDRMEDHYLIPQVEGGERKYKGFERALNHKFVPGKGARLTKYGNITPGQVRQVLSVLGKAEINPAPGFTAGYKANLTKKSAKRNTKARDYVYLPRGSKGGKLPPGVYERVVRGKGVAVKQRKKISKFGTFEQGRKRGKFYSVIRARGLKPILIHGKDHGKYKPIFKFYTIAERQHARWFDKLFAAELARRVGP